MALTVRMRDVLLQHIDYRPIATDQKHPNWPIVRALLARRMVRYGPGRRHTVLTEQGRRELCKLLAQYADVLVAAGFDEMLPAAKQLNRGRLTRRPAVADEIVIVDTEHGAGVDKFL